MLTLTMVCHRSAIVVARIFHLRAGLWGKFDVTCGCDVFFLGLGQQLLDPKMSRSTTNQNFYLPFWAMGLLVLGNQTWHVRENPQLFSHHLQGRPDFL